MTTETKIHQEAEREIQEELERIPEEIRRDPSWRERFKDKYFGMRLAERSLNIAKDQRRQVINEHAVRNAQRVAAGKDVEPLPDKLDDEDMAVRVGDEIHYHLEDRSRDMPPPRPQESPKPSQGDGGGSDFWKGFAIMATAVPLAALGGYLVSQIGKEPANPPAFVDTDTDTKYDTGMSVERGGALRGGDKK